MQQTSPDKEDLEPKKIPDHDQNTWNRHDLKKILAQIDDKLTSLGRAGGTLIYVGTIDGRHIAVTNHHVSLSLQKALHAVLQTDPQATGIPIEFPRKESQTQNVNGLFKRVIASWRDIDFALVEFEGLADKMKPFNFRVPSSVPDPREKLYILGYGSHLNRERDLTLSLDDDCQVMSQGIQLIKDPDPVIPGLDSVWSFATGCDVSHGSSGGPILNRETGKVVGIVWTTWVASIGNDFKQRTTQWLHNLRSDNPEIWTHLSYGVPLIRIHETICNDLRPEIQLVCPKD